MRISATFILTIAAALSLVLAKPQLHGKAEREDITHLIDDILSELGNNAKDGDTAVTEKENNDTPISKNGKLPPQNLRPSKAFKEAESSNFSERKYVAAKNRLLDEIMSTLAQDASTKFNAKENKDTATSKKSGSGHREHSRVASSPVLRKHNKEGDNNVEIKENTCGGSFTGPIGTITSPNYPDDVYPPNLDCEYHVEVESGKVIEFLFTSVAIFYGDDCEFDNVTILEGDSDIIFGPYCGYSTPHTIVTTTNTATVLFKTDDIFQRDGFSVDFTAVGEDGNEDCGGSQYTGSSGAIRSPNYPNLYDNNMNCKYHLTVPTGKIIKFVFTSFAMESTCSFDSLSVFDGESITAPSLGTYCGHSLPEPIYTTGRYAMLHFKTDGSIRYSGFSVGFTALDEQPMTTSANIETTSASSEACGDGSFTGSSGTIMSPNYPNVYGNNMNCLYHVTVDLGKVIEFDFTSFSLEFHSSCGWDRLIVYDGATANAPSLGTYCGFDLPRPILTTGNNAVLLFESDSSSVSTGFSVDYAARDHGVGETTPVFITPTSGPSETCGASYAIATGVIASPNYPDAYGANLNCEYYVVVEPGKAIVFVFTSFDLDYQPSCTSDSLTILDGNDATGPPIGTYCGSNTPEVITTSGNAAMLVFITDGSGSNTGFSVNFMAIDQSGGSGGGPTGDCGGNLFGLSGTIQSPNYPSNYSNLLDCVWTIHVPESKIIRFSVINFELEFQKTCSSDFVEILDGDRIIGQYCGNIHCGIPTSTGNVVTVRMRTNGTGNAKGFSINYVAADPPTSSDTSCGLVTTTTYKDGSRIINGVEALPNALPWQTELQKDGEFLCGASVIHNSWILTAAHCISPYDPPSTYTIIAGTIHRDSHSSTAQIRTATEVIIHEGYDDDIYINDIALLKVSPLTITDAVRTICIPNSDAAVGTACTISGWGNTNSDNSQSPQYPTELLETDLFIRDPSSCLELYEADYSYTREKQLCGSNPNKDTCQGDSGGPFALLDGRRYFLEGITSYGFGCATPDITGAYTRVQAYTSWIAEKTNGDVVPFSG